MIFQTEKQLSEYGEKLSEGNKTAINEALTELKAAHQSQDGAQIDSALEKINAAWTAASQEMYADQGAPGGQAQPGPDAGGAQGGSDDSGSAQDVEFEEVK